MPMAEASGEPAAMLHSLFNLCDGVSEAEFKQAFHMFVEHLKAKGFAKAYRIMRRQPLPEFGAAMPNFTYYAAIEFHDLSCEQACYDYVAENSPIVRALHLAMNSKVERGARFFVTAEM
jgi:Family of unknown function (DUF6614)